MSLLAGLSQQGDSIADAQPLDSDLTALAGLSTTGLVARTGAGTAATRTITGTANQVTVTNGDGISGNPTLALPQSIAPTSTPQFSRIGLGTASPSGEIEVVNESSFPDIRISGYGWVPGMTQQFARGTVSTPAIVQDGDRMMAIFARAYRGDIFTSDAIFAAIVDGAPVSNTYVPTRFTWETRNSVGRAERMRLDKDGKLRLLSYGAGTLVTDSSGNVTASSDVSLKTVTGSFSRGLEAVLKLTPRTYHWNKKSGMDTEDENVGFIAQEVLESIPEAVGQYRTSEVEVDGKRTKKREKAELLTLSDRPLIAALVNAVKELKAENDELRKRLDKLETKK